MKDFRHRRRDLLKDTDGFSLSETMVTLFIYCFIAAACYGALVYGSNCWKVNSVAVELQQELRKGMDWITEDLRQSGTSAVVGVPVDGYWYNTITFKTCTGINNGNISWAGQNTQYSKGGTGSAQLLRTTGGTSKVIAQDFQTVQFRRQAASANIVDVALTVQKNMIGGRTLTRSSNFQVKMRN